MSIKQKLDKLIIEILENWVNKPNTHYCKDGKEINFGCMHCQNKIANEIYNPINGNITKENIE